MNLTSPFAFALYAIVGLSLTGLPVAYAMIGGSILWLFLSGIDMISAVKFGRGRGGQTGPCSLPIAWAFEPVSE